MLEFTGDRFDKYRDDRGRIDLLSLYHDEYGSRPHGYAYDMLEELMSDPGVVSRQITMIAIKTARGFDLLASRGGDWRQW